MKFLTVLILCALVVSGCAGHGLIREYKIVDGEKVLTGITEFKGRNIKAETADGAKIETKSWTMPDFPQTIIGR